MTGRKVRYRIALPWPDKRLGANARLHWAAKAKVVKGARLAAAWTAKEQGAKKMLARKVNATITLHPPDARRRDMPNFQYATKSQIDGVADVIDVDDYHWKITWIDGEPVRPDGAVIMEIESA